MAFGHELEAASEVADVDQPPANRFGREGDVVWAAGGELGQDQVTRLEKPGNGRLLPARRRRKLDPDEPDGVPIETVRGFGYRFRSATSRPESPV
ncbi:MAG: winged helix-turn-helix domain-containing protein [bacterium]